MESSEKLWSCLNIGKKSLLGIKLDALTNLQPILEHVSVPLTAVIPAYLFSCRSEAKITEDCGKRGEIQLF